MRIVVLQHELEGVLMRLVGGHNRISQFTAGVGPGPSVGEGAGVGVGVGTGTGAGVGVGRKSLNIWRNLSTIWPLPAVLLSCSIRTMRAES